LQIALLLGALIVFFPQADGKFLAQNLRDESSDPDRSRCDERKNDSS
jgi:hypothetical protein